MIIEKSTMVAEGTEKNLKKIREERSTALTTAEDNKTLNSAIDKILEIVKENRDTAYAKDHMRLANWLNELHIRRTGNGTEAMKKFYKNY